MPPSTLLQESVTSAATTAGDWEISCVDGPALVMNGEDRRYDCDSVEAKYELYEHIYWWLRRLPGEDDLRAVGLRAQFAGEFVAAETGQLEVAEHDFRLKVFGEAQCPRAVGRSPRRGARGGIAAGGGGRAARDPVSWQPGSAAE